MSLPKIKELVSINKHAVMDTGIQLDWYKNKELNLRLCKGYMFSTGSKYNGRASAVDLLKKFKDNLLDDTKDNKHIIISGYGSGKTHFALVVANYFSSSVDSQEVKGICESIEKSSKKEISQDFMKFKESGKPPQLVIRLQGDNFSNLRTGFLKALKEALTENSITQNYQLPVICSKALEWLRSLNEEQRKKSENFLISNYNYNLLQLEKNLEEFKPISDTITVELCKYLFNITPDFGSEASLKTIIEQVYKDLCCKPDGPFYKIIILFDELGLYIDNYREDKAKAGGSALQEITNACGELKGKLSFVSFIQYDPAKYSKEDSPDDIDRFLGRVNPENKIYLATNLELVIPSIIVKNENAYSKFIENNYRDIDQVSNLSHLILPYYKKEGWDLKIFTEKITRACFPLHPITTSTICKLDFAQGRTIISFINQMVEKKLEESSKINILGKAYGLDTYIDVINWIYPYEIAEYFKENFKKAKDAKYQELTFALNEVGHNAPEECLKILKCIFLYYVLKLEKGTTDHAKKISVLSGLDIETTINTLKELKDKYKVIHMNEAREEYDFYTPGISILDVDRRLNLYVSKSLLFTSIDIVNNLEKSELNEIFSNLASKKRLSADEFIRDRHIDCRSEYKLKPVLVCPDSIKESLKTMYDTLDKNSSRGFLFYCISEVHNELLQARSKAHTLLNQFISTYDNYPLPIIFAFPEKPVEGIGEILLKLSLLDARKQEFVSAYNKEVYEKAREDLKRELGEKLQIYLDRLEFVTHQEVIRELLPGERNQQETIINKLFRICFTCRPPLNSANLKTGGGKGKQYIGLCSRFLCNYGRCNRDIDLKNCDGPAKTAISNIINNVLLEGENTWEIIKDNKENKVSEPKDIHIRKAWNLLNKESEDGKLVKLSGIYKILQEPPFGYDDLTFSLFLSSWIGFYRNELDIHTFQGKKDFDKFCELFEGLKIISILKKEEFFIKKLDKEEFRKNFEDVKEKLHSNISNYIDMKELIEKAEKITDDRRFSDLSEAQRFQLKRIIDDKQKKLKDIENFWSELDSLYEKLNRANSVKDLCEIRKELIHISLPEFITYSDDKYKLLLNKCDIDIQKQLKIELIDLTSLESYKFLKNKFSEIKDYLKEANLNNLTNDVELQIIKLEEQYEAIRLQENQKIILQNIRNLPSTSSSELSFIDTEKYIDTIDNYMRGINIETYKAEVNKKREEYRERLKHLNSQLSEFEKRIYNLANTYDCDALQKEINNQEKLYKKSKYEDNFPILLDLLKEKKEELREKEFILKEKNKFFSDLKHIDKAAEFSKSTLEIYNHYCQIEKKEVPTTLLNKLNDKDLEEINKIKERIFKKFSTFLKTDLDKMKIVRGSDYEYNKKRLLNFEEKISPIGKIDRSFVCWIQKAKGKLEGDQDKFIADQEKEERKRDISKDFSLLEENTLNTISNISECDKLLEQLEEIEVRIKDYNLFNFFEKSVIKQKQKIEEQKDRHIKKLEKLKNKAERTEKLEELEGLYNDLALIKHVFDNTILLNEVNILETGLREKINQFREIIQRKESVKNRFREIKKRRLNTISLCNHVLSDLFELEEEIKKSGLIKDFEKEIAEERDRVNLTISEHRQSLNKLEREFWESSELEEFEKVIENLKKIKHIFEETDLIQNVSTLESQLNVKIKGLRELQTKINNIQYRFNQLEEERLDNVYVCDRVLHKLTELTKEATDNDLIKYFSISIEKLCKKFQDKKDSYINNLTGLKRDFEKSLELKELEDIKSKLTGVKHLFDSTSLEGEISSFEQRLGNKLKEIKDRENISSIHSIFNNIVESKKKTECLFDLFNLLSQEEQEIFLDSVKNLVIIENN